MEHIFISYSHTDPDRAYAQRLAKALEQRGFSGWIDDLVDYGTQWPQVLQERLDECAAVIVIMTPRSYRSKWVQNELARASRKEKPIFPMLLEGDAWLAAEATQYVDVRDGGLPPYDFYERLAEVLRAPGEPTSSTSKASEAATRRRAKSLRRSSRTWLAWIGVVVSVVVLFLVAMYLVTRCLPQDGPNTPCPRPSIDEFSVSPKAPLFGYSVGDEITIRWKVTDATFVYLNGSPKGPRGSLSETVTNDTTYMLVAENGCGESKETVSIVVELTAGPQGPATDKQ